MESVTAKTAMPAPKYSQLRSRRPRPAAMRADHGAEQDHVAERIGQVRRDRRCVAARRRLHRAEDDRRTDRSRGQRRDHAVQPQPRVQLRHPLAGEQQDADVADGEEPEPERVGDRGIGRLGEVGQHELPVEVAGRPQREGDADDRPRDPLAAAERAASDAQHRRADQDAVVDDLVHRPGHRQPRRPVLSGDEHQEREQDPEEHADAEGHRAPRDDAERTLRDFHDRFEDHHYSKSSAVRARH